jgi:uncharacterized damage-inducible protein DinB
MKNTELFLAQLEREAAISHRALEKVPEGKAEWKPHVKSMPLGYLSNLVAMMPAWIELAIKEDELDLNPPGGKGKFKAQETPDRASLLRVHEESVAKARAAIKGTNDEFLLTPWRLLVGGRVVQESPRLDVIADTFTHLAHHRGQLTVYLRLNEIPVPSIYGPTADDKSF